jgi:predicted ATPase
MFNLNLEIENFLAIKKANLESKNNITVLIAPNKAGKSQLLLLLYAILWSFWKEIRDKENMLTFSTGKLKNVLLIKNTKDIISWNADKTKIALTSTLFEFNLNLTKSDIKKYRKIKKEKELSKILYRSPIYFQSAGLGDYYKGIYSLKKYYPQWKLISEAVTDLISDLFIVADERVEPEKENRELMELFEKLFSAKFFIQNRRIYIQEKGRKYGLERTASGLKSLSWFYLILRYNLLGGILFIDEPEVNLHPTYIDRLVYFLCNLAKSRKVFIATHSDYLLESLNKFINKENIKVDVWIGDLQDNGAYYSHYEADKDNLIDTSPLIDVYLDILKEGFGHE